MTEIRTFLSQLNETHFSLKDYVDFQKVASNVDVISMRLNQLNYLIGKSDMEKAVRHLWDENPNAFTVLEILIAVRPKDHKKAIQPDGSLLPISDYFQSPKMIVEFLDKTGLTKVFQERQITNLVDYVFGIEVGLDSNARKNRGGTLMEDIVANIFSQHRVPFEREVEYDKFPDIKKVLGADKKRFDFVIRTLDKTYLIEVNFYSGGGSKPNEVARSYSELAPKINSIPGYEFVWITDGVGWTKAKNKIEEALTYIPSVYNLTTITDFISNLKF